MVNYENGKIYKIVCNITGETYYGHTNYKYLSKRISNHRSDLNRWKRGVSKKFCTSFSILERGDYTATLLEKYPCSSKDELKAREQFYILNNKCVNMTVPLRTKKEYREATKEHIRERDKNYREANRDKLLKQKKEYYHQNKDKINEKVKCECGLSVCKSHIKRHQASKNHKMS